MKKLVIITLIGLVVLVLAICTITITSRSIESTKDTAIVLGEEANYYKIFLEKGKMEMFLPVESVSIPLETKNRINVVVIKKRLANGQYDIGVKFKSLL